MQKLILASPIVLILNLIVSILLLGFGVWIWAVGVLVFAFIFNWRTETFALHPFKNQSDHDDFRILTYNVNRAHEISVNRGTTKELIDFILEQKADIIFLQEYNVDLYPQVQDKLSQVYPYGSGDEVNSRFKSVYCKYPIEYIEQLMVDADDPNYSLFQERIYCKHTINGKEILPICRLKVRIRDKQVQLFNCHLMSNNYSVVVRNLQKKGKSFIHGIPPIWHKIDFGYKARELQTQIICEHIEPDLPTIICGDFNEVSEAPSLQILQEQGFVDAWWKKGFGFGFTFHGMGLRFRLDHVMYSADRLDVSKIEVPHSEVSDHFPVVCDFSFIR